MQGRYEIITDHFTTMDSIIHNGNMRFNGAKSIAAEAFRASLPVLTGYSTMGFAAGVLLALHGGLSHPVPWAGATSAVFVSGPLQFLLVDWIRSGTAFVDVVAVIVCLNIRYSLYGISLLDRFKSVPLLPRLFLIGVITDETYALQVQCPYPNGRQGALYCFLLGLFDVIYWIGGVMAGTFAGAALPFEAKGIDFAMTALFLVILTDLCRERANRLPAVLGVAAAAIAAAAMQAFLSSGKFLAPALALIVAFLLAFRNRMDPTGKGASE